MLKKYSRLFVVLVVMATLGIGGWAFTIMTQDSDAIPEAEAFQLIQQCKVIGIYSYDSGEAGVILKPTLGQSSEGATPNSSPTDNLQRVADTTPERLLQHQNSACPFTHRIVE